MDMQAQFMEKFSDKLQSLCVAVESKDLERLDTIRYEVTWMYEILLKYYLTETAKKNVIPICTRKGGDPCI